MIPQRLHPAQRVSGLAFLGLFGLAFGYVEGAVAHYLRMHFYPEGFDFELKDIDIHTLAVELGREGATMAMLFSVAWLSGGPPWRRVANFVFVFGIWDIAYYGALWLFERWPRSLMDWDVLFLIPVPWFAPVLVPVGLSLAGVLGAVLFHYIEQTRGRAYVRPREIMVILSGLLISLWAVTKDFSGGSFPEGFAWDLYMVSIVLVSLSYGSFYLVNRAR